MHIFRHLEYSQFKLCLYCNYRIGVDLIPIINSMLHLHSVRTSYLTTLLAYTYRTPQRVASFKQRIARFNHSLDRYDRQFHMRPPSLKVGQPLTFPLKIPFRVRHRFNPNKGELFTDNSSHMHWNRMTPNELLLAFEHVEYLEFEQMMEGLRFLSQIQGQEEHDWNSHPWVSKALDRVNKEFVRVKRKNNLSIYYLMKKLKFSNPQFWTKVYSIIEEDIYDLYPSQFQKFFLKYYKVSDQYFSSEMKQKFLTLVEGRLRSFSPEGIIKVYEIYQEEDRLNDYWKYNVFIPLFKSEQYGYCPKNLHKIFRFMLVLGHEKDDRLYASLYKRLMNYTELTEEQIDLLQEVVGEVKDLFISHRVDPYVSHLKEMRKKMKQLNKGKKKEIPIQELVRQDLVFFLHKQKLKTEELKPKSGQTPNTTEKSASAKEETRGATAAQ